MSTSVTPWTVDHPPGSSLHGILQARILEWVAIPFSRGSSQPRNWTRVSCLADRFFILWLMGKAQKFLLKLILKAVQILNNLIATKETVLVINLFTRKATGPPSYIGVLWDFQRIHHLNARQTPAASETRGSCPAHCMRLE